MSLYTHFSTEERELSMVLKAQGYNISQIAKKLGKNRSSVSREFARNSNKDERTADVSLFFKQMKT